MPPREETPRSSPFGESQPLMSSSSSSSEVQGENEILREEEAAWNNGIIGNVDPRGHEETAAAAVVRSRTFWQAVEERRNHSDQEIARDVAALSRRRKSKYTAIAFGQLLALIIASSNASSFVLENSYGILAPNFMLFCMYTLLSCHLFFRSSTDYSYTTNNNHHQLPSSSSSSSSDNNNHNTTTIYRVPILGLRLKIPWYLYFILSLTDVGAGIIMLIALQYTSLTSVTLLTSLTIPSTMICSKILLNKSFHKHHALGVCLCLVGGCLTIWSDLDHQRDYHDNNSNALSGNTTTNITTDSYSDSTPTIAHNDPGTLQINWGDILAVIAALIYGFGDAASEYLVKHIDRMELLGMLGLFGMILTGIQFPFQEREVLSNLFFSGDDDTIKLGAFLLIASYVIFVLLYYVTEAAFLVNSDATLLNLSLQAQNLWAILFSVFANQSVPPVLFYLALVLVIIGVFVYELGGPSADPVLQLVAASESETEAEMGDPSSSTISRGINNGSGDTHHRERRRPGRHVQYDSLQQIEIT